MRFNVKVYLMFLSLLAFVYCGEQNQTNEAGNEQVQVDADSIPVAADTVNMPELVVPKADGALLLTAQNGRAAGTDIKYMPEWRAFGWFTAADSVEWEVDVKESGNYEVNLEWSVSDEEAGKEFILTAGDQQLTGIVDKSGSWETFKTKNVGTIKLQEGRQKIVFRSKTKFDKGAILDLKQIRLVRV